MKEIIKKIAYTLGVGLVGSKRLDQLQRMEIDICRFNKLNAQIKYPKQSATSSRYLCKAQQISLLYYQQILKKWIFCRVWGN